MDEVPLYREHGADRRTIRTNIYANYSDSMNITKLLDREAASGTNRSNRCTNRVFIIHTRRDQIEARAERQEISDAVCI